MLEHEFGYHLPPITRWHQLETLISPEHWTWLWNEGVVRGLFRYGKLIRGGLEAMRELAGLACIVVITHRPPQARADTLAWLAYHRIVVDEFHVLGQSGVGGKFSPKSAIPCDAYLDDAPHNLKDFLLNTRAKVIGFERPWNDMPEMRDNSAIYWAKSWPEVVRIVSNFVRYAEERA